MASTYSTNLKIELIATGEQSGTWGTTTNTNLGTALEQAIVGYGNPNFTTDADLTITLTDSNATQTARAFALNVTSGVSLTTTRNLIVPTIQKPYLIYNNTSGSQSIVVKTSAGTGVTVPSGARTLVYVDGTNVVSEVSNLPTLTLNSALAVSSGGTGASTLTSNNVILGNGTSAVQFVAPGSSGNLLTSNGTTWQSTAPAAVNLASGVTGTLPVANGGTGATTLTANNVILGNGTSAVQTVAPGTSGNLLTSNGTTWTSAAPAVPSFGAVGSIAVLFNFSGTNVAAGNSGGISSASLGYASGNIVTGTSQIAISTKRAGNVTAPGTSTGGSFPDTTAVSGTWMSLSGCGARSYDTCNDETTANTGLFVRTA